MANCAYCGAYIKEGGNTQMFKSLGKSMGLEIVGDAIGGVAKLAGNKKYCSQKCKEAAEGKGGNNSKNDESNASAGQITTAINEAAESTKKDGMQAVMEISFDGDAATITNAISNLFTIAASNVPGGIMSSEPTEVSLAKKGIRAAAIEKIELGIVNLRNKGDIVNADYFQKKYDEIKPKKGLFGRKK